MLFIKIITIFLIILQTDAIKTTSPVSIIFEGFTLKIWNEQSLWNKTQLSIVYHLNKFCKKDYHCDAEYGIGNIHLITVDQYESTSVRLNITADKPVLSSNMKSDDDHDLSSFNYTELLKSALFQAKLDIERLYDNRLFYLTTHSHQNLVVSRTSRLLFVLIGIILVALIFGLTVLFFQKIRRHSYSKLLKPIRTGQTIQDEPLTNSPSMSVLRQ